MTLFSAVKHGGLVIMILTNKELEILKLLTLPNRMIARRLKISEGTVKSHVGALFGKFPNQKTRAGILIQAVKDGVLILEEIL